MSSQRLFTNARADLKLMRSLPHGHVAAALGTLRKLGLDDLLAQGERQGARTVPDSVMFSR